MWVIGLVIGFSWGTLTGGVGGALGGAALGAVLGWIVEQRRRNEQIRVALNLIEKRLGNIETAGGRKDSRPAHESVAAVAPSSVALDPVVTPAPAPIAESITPPTRAQLPEQPRPRAEPPAPPQPPATNPVWSWLVGGNTIVRVGVLIFFIGLSFLVKYAADHALFPLEVRLALSGAGAVVLLVLGWKLRINPARSVYALTLQGAGIGGLYLTVFAAFRLFHLIPGAAAFPLLAAIVVLAGVLAVRQDAMALAVTGAIGGFLAPILASTGGGSHVTLFGYYAVLNAGILGLAWAKAWRPLNLVGFVFTFAIGLVWGAQFYRPEMLSTTEPFLVVFFLMYVAIAVLYAFAQAPRLTHYVDGTLIFGVPIVGFGLQAGLVQGFEYALALSALTLSAFYVSLAAWLRSREQPQLQLLIESFFALAVIFGSLAIPLALDARWSSAAWALEGAGVYWVGARQSRTLARAFALALQVAAALAFSLAPFGGWEIVGGVASAAAQHTDSSANQVLLGALLLALSGLVLNRLMHRHDAVLSEFERSITPLLFVWAFAWWLFAGFGEIERRVSTLYVLSATICFIAATVLATGVASVRLQWREARWPMLAYPLGLTPLVLAGILEFGRSSAHLGWLAFPFAFAVNAYLLHAHQPADGTQGRRYFAAMHVVSVLLFAVAATVDLRWHVDRLALSSDVWLWLCGAAVPAAVLGAISSRSCRGRWPVRDFARSYWLHAGTTLAIWLALWSVLANVGSDAAARPLPYLPLLNPIDLAQLWVLIAVWAWWKGRPASLHGETSVLCRLVPVVVSAVCFAWMNAVLLRSLHHWADIPYEWYPLMRSVLAQTALSLFWTALALALMVWAVRSVRTGRRRVWMAGAGLMAVVVAKLFFRDLSHLAGIERIVAFMGVGVLMLVIGYFAPVPPKSVEESPK